MDDAADKHTVVGDLVGEEAVGHVGLVHGVDRRAVVLAGDRIVEHNGVGG